MNKTASAKTFSIGSLVYSKQGLFVLFGWLLWGDFVFYLMEAIVPNVMPVLFKDAGASNQAIGIILGSFPLIITTVFGPFIGTLSDNTRTRWGRRKPFLFIFSPLVVLFLCAIPFSAKILAFVSSTPLWMAIIKLFPVAPLVLVLGGVTVGFLLFNAPLSTGFYCLVPDVVPRAVIGRFYAMFRIFGTAATTVFNYFFLGNAVTHLKVIFISVGIFYLVAIWMVGLNVKEGEYPPLPAKQKRKNPLKGIENYLRTCFAEPYFIWAYLGYAGLYWSYISTNSFTILFFRNQLGYSVDAYGKLLAYCGVMSLVLYYPLGSLLDRWGSQKSMIIGMASAIVGYLLCFFFIHTPAQGVIFLFISWVPYTFGMITIMKWLADVYPPEKYGQFNSAGVLVMSIGGSFLGAFCGHILDLLQDYRYVFMWNAFFRAVSLVAVVIMCRHKPSTVVKPEAAVPAIVH